MPLSLLRAFNNARNNLQKFCLSDQFQTRKHHLRRTSSPGCSSQILSSTIMLARKTETNKDKDMPLTIGRLTQCHVTESLANDSVMTVSGDRQCILSNPVYLSITTTHRDPVPLLSDHLPFISRLPRPQQAGDCRYNPHSSNGSRIIITAAAVPSQSSGDVRHSRRSIMRLCKPCTLRSSGTSTIDRKSQMSSRRLNT